MRLSILDKGHGFGTKILFALIRTFSGHPVLDVIKLVKYRPDFYGSPMGAVTQEAMRGPSAWSVGDRELMAAVVARSNGCDRRRLGTLSYFVAQSRRLGPLSSRSCTERTSAVHRSEPRPRNARHKV